MPEKIKAIVIISLIVLGGFLGLICFEPVTVNATGSILCVGGTGADNYTTIQSAIYAAKSGDTVFVFNGTYKENIEITRTIKLIGENANSTIIDGGYNGNVIEVYANQLTISNFSIINGRHKYVGLGIYLQEAHECLIYNNILMNNNFSIDLSDSTGNKIFNNKILNNDLGLFIVRSSHNEIFGNNISSNRYTGISLMFNSNNNYISNNNISNCTPYGFAIEIFTSNGNAIKGNNLFDNWIGISCYSSTNNIIFQNNMVNSLWKHGKDSNGTNFWNDTYPIGGNYWSDYQGVDADGDGIGDTPYIIDEGVQDHYPLMEPWGNNLKVDDYITIGLKLNKTEYFIDEPISGSITVINDNSFDILLLNDPVVILTSALFKISPLDSNKEYLGGFLYEKNPIEIKANNTLIIYFKLDKFYDFPILSPNPDHVYLNAEDHKMYAYTYYNEIKNDNLLISNEVDFKIISNDSSLTIGNGKNQNENSFQTIIFISTGSIILIIAIISILVIGTEIGKYKFFASFIAPLYSRELKKRKKKTQDAYLRGTIYGYIMGNPGESYNIIKRKLNIKNGALAYHLKILETNYEIRSERDGMYRRFYPYEGRITKEVLELSKIQEKIVKVIEEYSGISQKEISERLNEPVQKINYHIQLLVDARVIRIEWEGKMSKCYIVEEGS